MASNPSQLNQMRSPAEGLLLGLAGLASKKLTSSAPLEPACMVPKEAMSKLLGKLPPLVVAKETGLLLLKRSSGFGCACFWGTGSDAPLLRLTCESGGLGAGVLVWNMRSMEVPKSSGAPWNGWVETSCAGTCSCFCRGCCAKPKPWGLPKLPFVWNISWIVLKSLMSAVWLAGRLPAGFAELACGICAAKIWSMGPQALS